LVAAETAKLVGRVAPFDDALAFVAVRLRVETRELGLLLGDRACLALAMAADLPVSTRRTAIGVGSILASTFA
jgi:PIN domain nuclease of toxin-antitoxin system